MSVDARGRDHHDQQRGGAAARASIAQIVGQPARAVFDAPDLQPLGALLAGAGRGRGRAGGPGDRASRATARSCTSPSSRRALVGDSGAPEGVVLVLDDVTPLIRAQKVAAWREVARRLAHEIKNPLTPIQLSAERLRRHFAGAPPAAQALVDECTATIVGEVESLKGLVDEFSQFARMPSPRTVPTDLAQLITDTLALYNGHLHRRDASSSGLRAGVPLVRLDPEQIRRVIINLVDNAIEAMERRGADRRRDAARRAPTASCGSSSPTTARAFRRPSARSCSCRTTRPSGRGSGLGLAIVRRIIAEHGGSIEVGDNTPRGTRFTIELPC